MRSKSRRIYLTHCSAAKAASFRESEAPTTPDRLYTSRRLQAFVRRCRAHRVVWAILSDRYGIWFPGVEHPWYDKHPNSVSPAEFHALVADFDTKLEPYGEIWFYHHPSRFHRLYRNLLEASRLNTRIRLFSKIEAI